MCVGGLRRRNVATSGHSRFAAKNRALKFLLLLDSMSCRVKGLLCGVVPKLKGLLCDDDPDVIERHDERYSQKRHKANRTRRCRGCYLSSIRNLLGQEYYITCHVHVTINAKTKTI